MDIDDTKILCSSFKGVTEQLQKAPANILCYCVGGKRFAYFKTSSPEKWRFSVRVQPCQFLELTDQPDIKPAKYMHRFHWVTIVDVCLIEQVYIKSLITWSYEKALSSLSKKCKKKLWEIE